MELRRVRAGDLDENPGNWRRHPQRQRRALSDLLAQVGYADALLAREVNGRLQLVDGHLRASLDPDQVVPVLVLDLSEEEADLVLATLDPLAGLAQADPERLLQLQARIGSSSEWVRQLLAGVLRGAGLPLPPGSTDPEEIPPLQAIPLTRPGDLWQLGPHRLYCADATCPGALERLMQGEVADVLWTDPPYGVGYVGKTRRALRIRGDDAPGLGALLASAFGAADRHLRSGGAIYVAHPAGPGSLTFTSAFAGAGWELCQTLVWVKDRMVLGHGDYHYRHEPVLYGHKPGGGRAGRGGPGWYGGNAETSVFEIPRPSASTEHPTAKPVELVRRHLQNSAPPAGLVLDPFAGSGTTIIAAHQLGRRCFSVELDPAYADVALRRFERFTGEKGVRL